MRFYKTKLFTYCVASVFMATCATQSVAARSIAHGIMPVYTNPSHIYYQSCIERIKPTHAIIEGAIVIEGKRPKATRKTLDKKMEQLESILTSSDSAASIIKKEIMRGTRSIHPNQKTAPYVIGQRVQVTIEDKDAIDDVLEALMDAGMNRFGTNWNIMKGNNNQVQPMVLYNSKNLKSDLESHYAFCMEKAWTEWCKNGQNDMNKGYCQHAFACVKPALNVTSYNSSVQNVVNQHNGYPNNMNVTYPWREQDVSKLRFLSDTEIVFTSNINMVFTPSSNLVDANCEKE